MTYSYGPNTPGLTTRAEIRQEALRRAGGFVEDLTSDPDGTSAISDAMRYRFNGDDAAGRGMVLYEPTSTAANQVRVANTWDDSAGDATIDSVSPEWSTGDTVEYYRRDDPGPFQFNEALNRVLSESNRITESVIPTYEGTREYGLLNAPWIETAEDVLSVMLRDSPNILGNSGFEFWGRGSDSQLQSWELSNSAGTVTRIDGPYQRFAARLTRAGTDTILTQTVPIPIIQLYGEQISLFARVQTSVSSQVRLRVRDSTDSTFTGIHDGGGDWDELTATHTVNADAVGPLLIDALVLLSDGAADFENVVAVVGSEVPDWLKKYGDQHAETRWLGSPTRLVQMRGTNPVVTLPEFPGKNRQIVVQSLQPYFELTADSGTGGVTDMPFEMAVAGVITKLAEQVSVGHPNSARWNALGSYWSREYNRWKRRNATPRQNPTPRQQVVRSL